MSDTKIVLARRFMLLAKDVRGNCLRKIRSE
jgi:hypothetical protein